MSTYNIHEAKTHFSKLLKRVLKGEEVVIARAGKPIARILPIDNDVPRRIPGNDAGKIIIAPNFDDPLEEFDL
jgi:prevent-host-death family protein